MDLFRDIGRRVERFKQRAEQAAEDTRECGDCGATFHAEHEECPDCGSENVEEAD